MWIVIIIALVVFILFKIYDRDFIRATLQYDDRYLVEFENGKSPICKLLKIYTYENHEYYVFVPVESLKAIPCEDIIILQRLNQKTSLQFVFPQKEADEKIVTQVFKDFSGKYNFLDMN